MLGLLGRWRGTWSAVHGAVPEPVLHLQAQAAMTAPSIDRADALRLAIEAAAILGPPAVAAIARVVRAEWPELIGALERALESEPPPIIPTPPTAADGQAVLRSRREERARRRRER